MWFSTPKQSTPALTLYAKAISQLLCGLAREARALARRQRGETARRRGEYCQLLVDLHSLHSQLRDHMSDDAAAKIRTIEARLNGLMQSAIEEATQPPMEQRLMLIADTLKLDLLEAEPLRSRLAAALYASHGDHRRE